jgi:hypothetical protein
LLLNKDKEEGNYKRTREQSKTSTVYIIVILERTRYLIKVKYQWNACGSSTINVKAVEIVPEKETKSR